MDIQIFWDRGAPQGLEIPVARMITQILDIPVLVSNNPLLYNGFQVIRQQFDATAILSCLDKYKRRNNISAPLLLVIHDDIFKPSSRYVFGLARPTTGSSVVSTARLMNEFWDLPADERMLISRLVTEGAHEIGHLLGLQHCSDDRCIMSNPRCLDDLDLKKPWICDTCRAHIQIPGIIPDIRLFSN
ncbi:MAG: archaemetzincin family Zn-dependent metalloprotease [Methanobacteriota archaeon]